MCHELNIKKELFFVLKKNLEIRSIARKEGVALWQVAESYGLCDCSFSKLLRRELPEKKREKIISFIERLAAEKRTEVEN